MSQVIKEEGWNQQVKSKTKAKAAQAMKEQVPEKNADLEDNGKPRSGHKKVPRLSDPVGAPF